MNKYFSGQGILYLAKYDSNGKLGKFVDLGNVPTFGLFNESVSFVLENISKDNLQIIFGDYVGPDDGTKLPTVNRTTEGYELFAISKKDFGQVYLVFEGVNTADCNEPFRVDIPRITIGKPDFIEFLNTDLAYYPFSGTIESWDGVYISGGKYFYGNRPVKDIIKEIPKFTVWQQIKRWFRRYFVPKKIRKPLIPNVSTSHIIDPLILVNYLQTPEGERAILNILLKNKKGIKRALGEL